MLPFKKVLVPVDYSDAGASILPYVNETLRHFGADLTLVHAYGPEALGYIDLPVTNPNIADEAEENELARLTEFAQKNFPEYKVSCIVQLGEPGTVVESVIEDNGADLVMLPTHGRGPFRRMLLGSVTAKILHDTSPAVWTGSGPGMAEAKYKPQTAYKSILCAIDGTEESQAVLVAGAALARSYSADLALVHVVDVPHMTFEVDFQPMLKDLKNAADVRLREMKANLGVTASHIIAEGNVADSVRRVASDVKADLIVLGRGQDQGFFSRMWSDLYTIVREAPCPVLSI